MKMTSKNVHFCLFMKQNESMFLGKVSYVRCQSKLTSLPKSVMFMKKSICFLCEMPLYCRFIFYFKNF